MVKFEALANELLLELFEFLDSIHLLCAFHGLNSRFDALLVSHFEDHGCHLDFRRVSKRCMDIMCEQNLSSIIDRVISLRLSNDDETPNICEHLAAYGFTLDRFIHLQSLSLSHIPPQMLISIHLVHLNLIDNSHGDKQNLIGLFNNIWSLPKLGHCDLDFINVSDCSFMGPTIISLSIEYLSIKNIEICPRDLSNLFEHTPRLRHLRANLSPDLYFEPPPYGGSSLTTLSFFVRYSRLSIFRFLENMPNLRHLTVATWNFYLTGHEWQRIIVDKLPYIKIFRLRMNFIVKDCHRRERTVNELFDTFRTPFWLDEHRWFIRLEWNSQNEDNDIDLYTLPYGFEKFYGLNPNRQFKSTCPDDRDYQSSNCVRELWLDNKVKNFAPFSVRFPNIDFLRIFLPIHDSVWSIISTLDHLTSLDVSLIKDATESQLELLINRAPHLYSLTIDEYSAFRLSQMQITNKSIRRLCLRRSLHFTHVYFNDADCSELANSSIGCQCEVLHINIKTPSSIFTLINTMHNLRTLTCRCQEDTWCNNQLLDMTKDELVTWLEARVPSACCIHRDSSNPMSIQIWITQP